MLSFVFKMMNFVLKMMNFGRLQTVAADRRAGQFSMEES